MSKWTEITFFKQATEAKNVKFAIITMDEIISHSYWDIQEIQQCGENGKDIFSQNTILRTTISGLRMIQLGWIANCQLLISDNKVISLDNTVAPCTLKSNS